MFENLKNKNRQFKARKAFEKSYLDFIQNPKRFNDEHAQGLLRNAFVKCGTRPLKWAHKIQVKQNRYTAQNATSENFPLLEESNIIQAVESLKSNGYYQMPWTLPLTWTSAVIDKAKKLSVKSRVDDDDIQKASDIKPKASTYWHDYNIISITELQNLVNDKGIKEIIARYLECTPVLDTVAAWWTFPSGKADSGSAQLYHFDLDRIKWIKAFVYLSDVNENNGPHAYIRGSHISLDDKTIKKEGRLTDEEVFSAFSKNDEVVFTGPAGTMILEDTIGLHKGVPAIEGHRFIFEFEYSINHFGYPYPELPLYK
jgi:hypothetical protein